MHRTISASFAQYAATPPVTLISLPGSRFKAGPGSGSGIAVPSALMALVVNVVTQGFCIRGVNRLTAVSRRPLQLCQCWPEGKLSTGRWSEEPTEGRKWAHAADTYQRVSSTTVNLVLTVRKAVSLGLSVWYCGSGVTPGLAIGGAMVLGESSFAYRMFCLFSETLRMGSGVTDLRRRDSHLWSGFAASCPCCGAQEGRIPTFSYQ